MSKKYIIVLFLIFQAAGIYAQRPVRDKIKTLKVAFITERLSLSSEEAQTFWPIYNKHEKQLETIRRKERLQLKSKIGLVEDLTQAESSSLLGEFLDIQDQKHKAEQAYIRDLKNVLPAKKILLLLKAEEDFKKRLLQQYRRRQGGG
ncbi:hypothetical protein [Flagellimonas meridianipacifica]|uniref:LTXXQ motif family protein n=1 Tax=Flagellimonas meridianipacifica TaxID=1080225 RepID=A0A2T0MA51_9FLAO|nr:hypothetical protein [Allomuricauda pacifica]PRX54358.1 hypothetical protein CLV81_2758 [Allomuricauda pacifica]